MHSNWRAIAFCSFLVNVGFGQTAPPSAAQLEAFENYVGKPTARITWSKETGRIDTDQAHAVITAIVVQDAVQAPHQMRGIRIDLTAGNVKDRVYASEEFIPRLITALDGMSNSMPQSFNQSSARASANHCFGSETFWLQEGHAFSASQCVFGDWRGLSVNTGRSSLFRFTAIDSSPFAAAIARARDELKQR
jgi:hypothetical protein